MWLVPLLCLGGVAAGAAPAAAQTAASDYFPSGNYGYDQELGVTVLTRLHPEYDETGIRLGGFTIRPQLDQGLFDNTNVNGTAGSDSGSWGERTAGGIAGSSDWSRNSFEADVGFDHNQFFALPSDNYTNWNVGIGGGYTIGSGELQARYSHATYNQLGSQIGVAASETPAQNTTDTGEISYTFDLGRITVTPTLDFSAYRFGDITTNGVQQSQTDLNRNVFAAGVVTRYALTGGTGLLFVARGGSSNFIDQLPGQVSNDSVNGAVLAGLDYQPEGVWRYALLVGVETRSFSASQNNSYTAPIVSGQVVWSPTSVLTATGILSRSIEDPNTIGNDGYVLNQVRLIVDYELMRSVLLEGRAGAEYASYLQGGNQSDETVGGGVVWLVNRNIRLSLEDDFTNQNAPSGNFNNNSNASLSGAYTQNIMMLNLHLAL